MLPKNVEKPPWLFENEKERPQHLRAHRQGYSGPPNHFSDEGLVHPKAMSCADKKTRHKLEFDVCSIDFFSSTLASTRRLFFEYMACFLC